MEQLSAFLHGLALDEIRRDDLHVEALVSLSSNRSELARRAVRDEVLGRLGKHDQRSALVTLLPF